VNAIGYSYKTPEYGHRPFRRVRPNLFDANGWKIFSIHCWQGAQEAVQQVKNLVSPFKNRITSCLKSIPGIKKVTPLTQSILGKLIIYSVAETIGASIGNTLGRQYGGIMGGAVGRGAVSPYSVTATSLGITTTLYFTASAIDRYALFLFSLLATFPLLYVAVSYPEMVFSYGDSIGGFVGEWMGNIVGAILGGYSALVLAGRPTEFWDRRSAWNSYSFCMIRFLLTGELFNAVIVIPTRSYLSPLLRVPRQLICGILQTTAYNSNIILPVIKKCVQQRKVSRRLLTPLVMDLIRNKCFGMNARKQAGQITNSFLSPTPLLSSIITKQLEGWKALNLAAISSLLDRGISSIVQNSEELATLVLRSCAQYGALLKNSDSVSQAHEQFQMAFFHKPQTLAQHKETLQRTVKEAVIGESYQPLIIEHGLPLLWTENTRRTWIAPLIAAIKKGEIKLVGFPVMHKRQLSYLHEVLEIYLQYYILFILLKWNDLKTALTISEEEDLIVDINKMLFSFYLNFVTPARLSLVANRLIEQLIHGFFRIKELLSFCLQQPDQKSYLKIDPSKVVILEDYASVNYASKKRLPKGVTQNNHVK
jgi:hypothetical protein